MAFWLGSPPVKEFQTHNGILSLSSSPVYQGWQQHGTIEGALTLRPDMRVLYPVPYFLSFGHVNATTLNSFPLLWCEPIVSLPGLLGGDRL